MSIERYNNKTGNYSRVTREDDWLAISEVVRLRNFIPTAIAVYGTYLNYQNVDNVTIQSSIKDRLGDLSIDQDRAFIEKFHKRMALFAKHQIETAVSGGQKNCESLSLFIQSVGNFVDTCCLEQFAGVTIETVESYILYLEEKFELGVIVDSEQVGT